MKLTAKQEKFCQGIVAGLSQADAYRQAYDAAGMKPDVVAVKASELMANGKVTVRVQELRRPVMDALQYGLKEAMEEADEAFRVAKSKGNGGAMVAAATLRAKLNGLLKDRVDTNVTGAVNIHVTFG
jgi:phage terminase small subunit